MGMELGGRTGVKQIQLKVGCTGKSGFTWSCTEAILEAEPF